MCPPPLLRGQGLTVRPPSGHLGGPLGTARGSASSRASDASRYLDNPGAAGAATRGNVIALVALAPITAELFVQKPVPVPAPVAAGNETSIGVPGVMDVNVTKALFPAPQFTVTVQLV